MVVNALIPATGFAFASLLIALKALNDRKRGVSKWRGGVTFSRARNPLSFALALLFACFVSGGFAFAAVIVVADLLGRLLQGG